MDNELTFTECRLVVNESKIAQLNIFENKKEDIYEFDNVSYIVNCEIIDNKFFLDICEIWKGKASFR